MRKTKTELVAFLLLCLQTLTAPAQQTSITGVIAIQNSSYDRGKIEYLPNAEIEEAAEKPRGHTTSDAEGRFKLTTVGIPEKERFRLRVHKPGYEVVNADKLLVVAGQKEPVRLYVATHKYIVEARRRYYNTGYENAEKNLTQKLAEKERELQSLQHDANADQQKTATLKQEMGQLQAQYAKLDQIAAELANKYVAINLDDADTLYQNAFRLFQAGDLEGALNLWQDANLYGQIDPILAEERQIDSLKHELAERDSILTARKTAWTQGSIPWGDSLSLHTVNSKTEYDKFSGTVWYDNAPLSGVSIRGDTQAVTDAQGHFELTLPEAFDKTGVELYFYKEGYKTKVITVFPKQSGPIQLWMER